MNAEDRNAIGEIIRDGRNFPSMIWEIAEYMDEVREDGCTAGHTSCTPINCSWWDIFDKKAWILDIMPEFEFYEEDEE